MKIENILLTISVINRAIRNEFYIIGYKLFVGAILASAIIFSIIQVGNSLDTLLAQFGTKDSTQVIVYSSVTIVLLIALYILFNRDTASLLKRKPKVYSDSNTFILQGLSIRFVEGFVQGLKTNSQMPKTKVNS